MMEYMGTRHVVDPRLRSSGSTVPFAKRRVRGRPALAHAFAPVDTLDFQGPRTSQTNVGSASPRYNRQLVDPIQASAIQAAI
jgi:hypothetical protein